MYRSIGLTREPSPQADKAATLAEALSSAFGAEVKPLSTDGQSLEQRRLQRLRSLLPPEVAGRFADDDDGAPTSIESPNGDSHRLTGVPLAALDAELTGNPYDLLVTTAVQGDEYAPSGMGSTCQRLIRRTHVDTLIVKNEQTNGIHEPGTILVCVDGSQESYAGLKQALALARRFDKRVEAVGVYDPYLHYTLFNGIVNVLTAEASRVFKFADQEKLHEEIIDTGLAKIYQAHLEVADKVAEEEDVDIQVTLLDGKAFQKILRHVNRIQPWLLVLGRIGVHSDDAMDIGSTTENLMQRANCDILVTSSRFLPPVDFQAEAAIEWLPEAEKKMEKVPAFVKGVATMAIVRWAMEHGHSIITPSVINGAMGDLLPPSAAQAMGYVAEQVAIEADDLERGKTFLCATCGYSARDYRPAACPVCRAEGYSFEQIDRDTLQALGELERGALVEETFDGKTLKWSKEAKQVLHRVPSGYERRRAKARIEKTARVRGLTGISHEFAVDMIEQEMADSSYLSQKGEHVDIDVREDEKPDDLVARPREESPLPWTDAAWKRICRVPEGFMRDMTREKVEEYAASAAITEVNLELCHAGIAEGRKLMAEMLGQKYKPAPAAAPTPTPTSNVTVTPEEDVTEARCPVDHSTPASEISDSRCPVAHGEDDATAAPAEAAKCPVDHAAMSAEATETSGCPVAHDTSAAVSETHTPDWTPEATAHVESTATAMAEAGKFTQDRARDLAQGVSEERARDRRIEAIGESFMRKLGSQLGYGHPLSEKTTEHQFTWTPEAEARLETVPDFCREMTRWRVEWTAVKKDLGTVITPEIMDIKFDMWGEVSDGILERDEEDLPWDAEPMARLERIPEFIRGQVIQSVVGNARELGFDRVTNEVLDQVIDKWIRTGDFHEGQYGYK